MPTGKTKNEKPGRNINLGASQFEVRWTGVLHRDSNAIAPRACEHKAPQTLGGSSLGGLHPHEGVHFHSKGFLNAKVKLNPVPLIPT